jgi:uncharacterized protein YjiS (DUF1127 family)
MTPEILPPPPIPTPVTGIAVTLGDLVQAEEALQRLSEVKLPAKQAYHVAKLVRLIKAETQHYHSQREEAIRELGETSTDGQEVRVPPDKMPEFIKRLNEMFAIETRIDWTPLRLADLPDITAADLLRLGPLVTD